MCSCVKMEGGREPYRKPGKYIPSSKFNKYQSVPQTAPVSSSNGFGNSFYTPTAAAAAANSGGSNSSSPGNTVHRPFSSLALGSSTPSSASSTLSLPKRSYPTTNSHLNDLRSDLLFRILWEKTRKHSRKFNLKHSFVKNLSK